MQDKQDLAPHAATTRQVLGACFEVMNELGVGFLESVYKRALAIALRERGLSVRTEVHFKVHFHGQEVGHYVADVIVVDSILVELKTVSILTSEHQAQTINYLATTGLPVGLLVNFGKRRLEYHRLYRPNLFEDPAYPADPAYPVSRT